MGTTSTVDRVLVQHHRSPLVTPFQALYGCQPPTMVNYLAGSLVVGEVYKELHERDELLQQLKVHL